MKKSLVISTIATVLVVVVALTTATFAWFTASSLTTASTNFTVDQAGGAVDIYTWNKELEDYNAAPISAAQEFALGQYTQSYEWSATYANGAYGSGESAAQSAYRPLMPTKELDTTVEADQANELGLPNIDFIAAEAKTGGKINVTNHAVKPVVARFKLETSYVKTNANITITITIPQEATNFDINAGKNVRFVLFGVSQTPSADAQNFTFATNYNYITNAPSSDGQEITPGYDTVEFTQTESDAAATATSITQVMSTNSFSSETKSATSTLNFVMSGGVTVECYLYLWLEGNTTVNTSSQGQFTFQISVNGTDASAGGEGA